MNNYNQRCLHWSLNVPHANFLLLYDLGLYYSILNVEQCVAHLFQCNKDETLLAQYRIV